MNSLFVQLNDKFRSFTLYFFLGVAFFGVITSLPSGRMIYYDNWVESSLANVIVDFSLLILSVFILRGKFNEAFKLLRREKFMFLFLMWCLATALWSDFPIIVLKRWIRLSIISVCCLSFVVNISDHKEALHYLWNISLIYLGATVLSVLFLDHTIDITGHYVGLTVQKNVLGQVVFVTTIIGLSSLKYAENRGGFWVSIIGLFVSVFILMKTNSLTAILCTIIVSVIWIGSLIRRMFMKSGYGGLTLIFVSCLVGVLVVSAWVVTALKPGLLEFLFETAGRDFTFTDRVYLWRYIFQEIKEHIWFGSGFNGFWVVGNDKLYPLFLEFPWTPNHSHNGYLDILNETGLVGFIILLMLICSYVRRAWTNSESGSIFVLLLPSILLLNLSETTLFSRGHLTNTIFIISYLWAFKEAPSERGLMNN